MSEHEEEDGGDLSSIGEISDTASTTSSTLSIEGEALQGSPPIRGNLEKDSDKLRSKYKIVKEALMEERLAEVDRDIEEVEDGRHGGLAEALANADRMREERVAVAQERKKVKVETILNEYKAIAQGIKDEHIAIDREMLSKDQRSIPIRKGEVTRKSNKRSRLQKGKDITEDIELITEGLEESERESRKHDLVHSE